VALEDVENDPVCVVGGFRPVNLDTVLSATGFELFQQFGQPC
jgi:hypothetical protein